MKRFSMAGAWLFLASACAAAPAAAADSLAEADGAALFGQLCASCHGTRARGDGPVAPTLKVPPADLTTITGRSAGHFPVEQVRDMIDGRAVPPAHGTREMPVWGYELEARSADEEPGRATAQAATDRLVEYLRSIQVLDTGATDARSAE